MNVSIDDEWQQFLSNYSGSTHNLVDFQSFSNTSNNTDETMSTSKTTCNSLSSSDEDIDESEDESDEDEDEFENTGVPSKLTDKKLEMTVTRNPCEELYISTQTQIFFLNTSEIDVDHIFWNKKTNENYLKR